jgi:PAS domain S-box-containing protein
MNEREFRATLYKTLAIPVLALLGLAALLGVTVRKLYIAGLWVDHTDTVIAHANLLTRLIIDEETGLRGYIAYGRIEFLEPYRQAGTKIDREFEVLSRLVSDNPDQTVVLGRIRVAYTEWKVGAELAAHGERDWSSALQRKQMMDGVRSQIDAFSGEETRLHGLREASLSRATRLTYLSLVLGMVLAATVVCGYTVNGLRTLSRSYGALVSAAEGERLKAVSGEKWLRTTLRSIGDGVIASDGIGHVVFMNATAETLTGWSESEASGRSLSDIFRILNAVSRAVVESPVDKVRRLGVVVGLANHTVLIRRDGTEFHIDDSGAPIFDEHGSLAGVVLVFRDVTERRKAESALVRAEKLASAGRLSAAIAHEINNPLAAISNLLYLAKELREVSDVKRLVEQAEIEISRIAHITKQSLGFFRDDSALKLFSAASVINQTVAFYLSRATQKNVSMKTDIHGDVDLLGSAGELRQILSNLISNALDACSSADSVYVALRRDQDCRKDQTGARITVADTGCGIDPKKIPAIFEPFYTTKESTGTGLGLWVTRQLIEKHGGSIRVKSSIQGKRRGTIFRVFLPHVHAEVSTEPILPGDGNP